MKKKIFAAILVCAMVLTIIAPTTAFAGWEKQLDGSWKYYSEDEEYYYYYGIYEIDGQDYFFDENGTMKTGWIYSSWSGDWYYANSSGVLQKDWQKIGEKWYYFEPDNDYMFSDGIYTIEGDAYYFAPSGAMQTGWIKETYTYDDDYTETTWFYADSSGRLAKGWKVIGGKWYYFSEWNAMYSDGINWIDGVPYYFYPSGELGVGWIKRTYTYDSGYSYSEWYYADSSGALQTGWKNIGGSWYYFSQYGYYMYSNSYYTIDGKPYAFEASGRMITGWGKTRHEYGDGYVDETWYYADGSGVLQSGWLNQGGTWYYLDPNSYYMHTGYSEIDGKEYVFNGSGAWVHKAGWMEVKWPSDSAWYYLDANGVPIKGWQKIGGVWYYFNEYSGEMAANTVRMIYDPNTDRYAAYAFASNGAWITSNGWHQFYYPYDGGYSNWIYMENGTIVTGWKAIGGTWYYFYDPYGYMATGKEVIDNKIEEFTSGGAWVRTIKTPGWQKIYDSWFYVEDTNGTLASGWRTINGVKYYFDPYGHYMISNSRYPIDGDSYFFDESGALLTGWIYKWETFYANEDGKLQKGWQTIGDYKYYFDPYEYYMYRSGTYTIDGKSYEFDYQGHCVS